MSHHCDNCMGYDPYMCMFNPSASGPWFVVTETQVRPGRDSGFSFERAMSVARALHHYSAGKTIPHITTRQTRHPR